MNVLEARGLAANYGDRRIFSGIDLEIPEGKTVSVLGPSGCGKSTLLALAAGILPAAAGEIFFRGQKINGPSRERALIFQGHALFPWLTARGNVEFVFEAAGVDPIERAARAEAQLERVGLKDFGDHYPHQLSGGMQQRTGIARALAAEPGLLLLDEPFASLDVMNRELLLQDFRRLTRELRMSFLLVTHDIEEAIFMSDRIYLMTGGEGMTDKIEVDFEKPARLIDLKARPEYPILERKIHESLFTHA